MVIFLLENNYHLYTFTIMDHTSAQYMLGIGEHKRLLTEDNA